VLALPGFASTDIEGANGHGPLGDIVFGAALDAFEKRGDVQEIVRRGDADFVSEFGDIGGESKDGFAREGREHEHPRGCEIHWCVEEDAIGLVGIFHLRSHQLVEAFGRAADHVI
jgi:hypothetical protein